MPSVKPSGNQIQFLQTVFGKGAVDHSPRAGRIPSHKGAAGIQYIPEVLA